MTATKKISTEVPKKIKIEPLYDPSYTILRLLCDSFPGGM